MKFLILEYYFLVIVQMSMLPSVVDGLGSQIMQRRQLYAEPMSKLRLLMISRMAKPEEVLIVEDENGNIVRETMKDNDVLVQYKVFLHGYRFLVLVVTVLIQPIFRFI